MKTSGDTQIMILAAVRYCLGRQSYIVGICQDWLTINWKEVEDSNKQLIIRDIIEALMNDAAGSKYDYKSWQIFAYKHYEKLSISRQDSIQASLAYKKKPWPL